MNIIISLLLAVASILLSWVSASMVVVLYYMWKLARREIEFPVETWLLTGIIGIVTSLLAAMLLKSVVLFLAIMVAMFVLVKSSVLVVIKAKLPELYDKLQ
jgi:hypothetical protein